MTNKILLVFFLFEKNSINFFLRKIVLPLGWAGFAVRRPSPAPCASASFLKQKKLSLKRGDV
ncbi:MAG: hypothetical protein A2845_03715 [Candidatus Lloydbacteria bacterium RIFCSPHIGHO2_01_FULL_49_22]|uniref:Uncharacterized protein n=1 Tax=Candidatus Lloydbacteria bacterium RIFCSPHIGHO2_01_FULL_49_22 TaxID=1798658 RepID=A0A1G2CWZ0_9BACT|nr:MAG: hypothetical protein A2845_03715 [Candidatus Lloydbacteria bacterium RIFCSPHIGHO2_01_FULL_49_22]OGZ09036.1 MAG: hypothetical protein A3C14_03550 [Candidatus Lloydbacteria bacterium RIFCSPHIGHO2_02_FULL_50_18]